MKCFKRCVFIFLSLLLSSCSDKSISKSDKIIVSLSEGDNYTIKSDSIIELNKGDDASFEVIIDDGYNYDKNANIGSYENNVYTVKNVQMSMQLSFYIYPDGNYTINIVNDNKKGIVELSPSKTSYEENEEVIIKCTPNAGEKFISYSYNGYSHDYTKNHYKTTCVPFSYSSQHTLIMNDNLNIYVNYYEEGNSLVKYDGNGGLDLDGNEIIEYDFLLPKGMYTPSTLQGSRYFSRQGYVLESWNSKRDGSGVRVSLGSQLTDELYAEEDLVMYAQWVKESNANCFTFKENDDGYSIASYDESKNDNEELVIPRFYNNKPVTNLLSSSIKTNKKTLILSDNLLYLESNSVQANSLTTLIMYSSIKHFDDNALNMPLCDKCYINKNTYSFNHEETKRDLTRRVDILSHLDNDKKLFLFLGHSTLYQNHDLTPFVEKYGDEFNFHFFGATSGTSTLLMIDLAKLVLDEDSYLFFQMHEGAVAASGSGYDTVARIDLNFDLFSRLSFSKYKSIFFQSFNACAELYTVNLFTPIFSSEVAISNDSTGSAIVMSEGDYNVDNDNRGPNDVSIYSGYCKPGYYSNIHDALINLPTKNLIMAWTSYNKNGIKSYDSFTSFENVIKSDFSEFKFIDSIFDNIYEGQYFRKNDNSHLNVSGGQLRMSRWANLIW